MVFYAQWSKDLGNVPENPKTFDGIGSSVLMGAISLISLVGVSIYLFKINKKKA